MIVGEAGSASTQVTQRNSDAATADLNYDAFLKLLIATMKNQDPTQPNDPAQTLSQLASFSTVEQGIKTNSRLEALMSVTAGAQAGSLIGKTVLSPDGAVGVVKAVEVGNGGLIAIIEGGVRIPIVPGVTVSTS
ncbi:MAG: flagellar hook assembly protein FlgD [Alphaproteobacteria bacterium]|nr:flagellar hook assembly protein FlgD [Alphaproteobacteria bacterium]